MYIETVSNYGYVTYHPYTFDFPLTSVSCSNGENGIMTTRNIDTLESLFPYVTAFSNTPWNSENCGNCYKLSNLNGCQEIYVTAVDKCEPYQGGARFDLSQEAFRELFGGHGIQDGHGDVKWENVPESECKTS